MPALEKIINANVFIDGYSFLGKAREVRLPTVNIENTEHRPLGTFGTVGLPQGVGRMEMSIIFDHFEAAAWKRMDPFKPVNLTFRAAQQEYDPSSGIVRTKQVRIYARGTFASGEAGNVTAAEGGQRTITLSLLYYKLVIDSETICEIDPVNNIYIVNGQDVLASVRAVIGQ